MKCNDSLQPDDETEDIAATETIEKKPKVDREKFLASIAEGLDDPVRDIRWVYQALGADGLVAEDAPSPGAWGLYCELKEEVHSKHFYSGVFKELLKIAVKTEQDENHVDDGRKLFGTIERLLRERDDDATVLSDVEKRGVKDGTRQLAVSRTGA